MKTLVLAFEMHAGYVNQTTYFVQYVRSGIICII